jgi:hypothetical protein
MESCALQEKRRRDLFERCRSVVSAPAETVFYTQGATLFDVALGNLVFMNDLNVFVAGQTLLKSSIAAAWNAGRFQRDR